MFVRACVCVRVQSAVRWFERVSTLLQFISRYIQTIGIDYGVRALKLKQKQVKINFWDVGGSDDYFEIRNEFYRCDLAATAATPPRSPGHSPLS